MSRFQVLKCLYRSMEQHRRDQMGERAAGPFVRIGFYIKDGHIGIEHSLIVYDEGTLVYTLSNRY